MPLKLRNKQVPFYTMTANTWCLVSPVAVEPSPTKTYKGSVVRCRLHYAGDYTGTMLPDVQLNNLLRDGQATEILLPGNQVILESLTKNGEGKTVDPSPAVCVFKGRKDLPGAKKFNVWEVYGLEIS